MLKAVRYNISWKTIGNIRNKKGFKHSAISAGHIAPTFKKSPTASTPWIVKLIACINRKRIRKPKVKLGQSQMCLLEL